MTNRFRIASVAFGLVVAVALPALGADADWIKPAEEGVTDLTSSLVMIAGALIGLSIVGYGLWAAMTQRIDWARIWVFFFAALLVTVGPAAIMWFIEKMSQNGG
ncbi:MAG: hypothetical protein AB1918_09480 [Pseudomonadota bacterium]